MKNHACEKTTPVMYICILKKGGSEWDAFFGNVNRNVMLCSSVVSENANEMCEQKYKIMCLV